MFLNSYLRFEVEAVTVRLPVPILPPTTPGEESAAPVLIALGRRTYSRTASEDPSEMEAVLDTSVDPPVHKEVPRHPVVRQFLLIPATTIEKPGSSEESPLLPG